MGGLTVIEPKMLLRYDNKEPLTSSIRANHLIGQVVRKSVVDKSVDKFSNLKNGVIIVQGQTVFSIWYDTKELRTYWVGKLLSRSIPGTWSQNSLVASGMKNSSPEDTMRYLGILALNRMKIR